MKNPIMIVMKKELARVFTDKNDFQSLYYAGVNYDRYVFLYGKSHGQYDDRHRGT